MSVVQDCRSCGGKLEAFMSLGRMPIANGFLTEQELDQEYYFELCPAYCTDCSLFQLLEQPDPRAMFHENYAFLSSTSSAMSDHFAELAEAIYRRYLINRSDPFVVELGSNDGILLRHFRDHGLRHLGIEPARNVAEIARSKGLDTIAEFFTPELAGSITSESGPADCIVAANVMCHIPDIRSVGRAVKQLLAPDGVFVFEDPYLGDMLAKTSYDQIYDEHVFMFSALSVTAAFAECGLEVIDVEPQPTHGGSMRYTLAHTGPLAPSPRVGTLRAREMQLGFERQDTFERFRQSCERSRDDLKRLLEELRSVNKRIVGYGATSKSTTVLNYCGLTPDHIEFISDTTPTKQGRLSPGAHIPVKSRDYFAAEFPDFAVLFAWNHSDEIQAKERDFRESGGRWIRYVPEVGIMS